MMSGDPLEELRARIGFLERQVEQLSRRLLPVEDVLRPRAQPVVPPPIPKPPPTLHPSSPPSPPTPPIISAPNSLQEGPVTPKNREDAEYKLGGQVLPRVGAAVFLLGVAYLVGLGISRGWITPLVQFSGAVAICLSFIGLGLWKREEREDFGQLLVGIGSCGLYFSFAAGHVFHRLYEGEILVVLFMSLSLANLGFSSWRSSPTFLGIGLIGGLVGAVLPMRDQNVALNATLHFAIVLPCAFISVRNRWWVAAIALTALSGFALGPAFFSHNPWSIRIALLYADIVICIVAYSLAYEDNIFDPNMLFLPIVAVCSAVFAFWLKDGPSGSLHVAMFSVTLAALGFILRSRLLASQRLLASSVFIAATVVPFGWDGVVPVAILASLSIVFAAISLVRHSRLSAALGAVELALGVIAYVVAADQVLNPITECAGILALILASLSAAFAIHRCVKAPELILSMGALLIFALFTRFLGVSFGSATQIPGEIGITVGWMAYSLLLGMLSIKFRSLASTLLCWLVVVLALIRYSTIISHAEIGAFGDIFLAAALIGTTVFATYSAERKIPKNELQLLIGCVGSVVGLLFVRIIDITFNRIIGTDSGMAMNLGPTFYCVLCVAVGFKTRWSSAATLAWISLGAALLSYEIFQLSGPTLRTSFLLAFILLTMCVSAVTARITSGARPVIIVATMLIWLLETSLFELLLGQAGLGLKSSAAITVGWIIYAALLLVLGFLYRASILRYFSMAVFAATLVKVLAYDLSYLDPGVRVGILMALGLAMIAGGYGYVRNHRPSQAREEARGE